MPKVKDKNLLTGFRNFRNQFTESSRPTIQPRTWKHLNNSYVKVLNQTYKREDMTNISFRDRIKSQFSSKDSNISKTDKNDIDMIKPQNMTNQWMKSNNSTHIQKLIETRQKIESLPTVHQLIRDRDKIKQTLQKASNRYHYAQIKKDKKLKHLNNQKMKCQKIARIREDHQRQKQALSLQRSHLQPNKNQKKKSQEFIIKQKQSLTKSLVKSFNRKKEAAQQNREIKQENKKRIQTQKIDQFNRKRNLRTQVIADHRQQTRFKQNLRELQQKIAADNYISKINRQTMRNFELENRQEKAIPKLYRKIRQLDYQTTKYDQKAFDYSTFLRQV